MEQFKLKSIDDLDLEFIAKTKGQSQNPVQSENIVSQTETTQQAPFQNNNAYFQKPVQPINVEPTYTPQPERQQQKKPRPLVPIGQNNTGYSPVGAPIQKNNAPFVPNVNYDEVETEEKSPKKSSKGALAGKIISIVLLAATVIVFVLGCFISIFLDNGGSNLGGICFNTMSTDTSVVSKGDLIISKISDDVADYASDGFIAVPSATQNGCDVMQINSAETTFDGNISINAYDLTTSTYTVVMASNSYGVVSSYVPALGGLISFAIENAILVCVLFVLLAAFWCLLLVLLEKSGKPASANGKQKKAKK